PAELREVLAGIDADVFSQYVKRRTAIELDDNVVLRARDFVPSADRGTALGQPGGDSHRIGKRHARETAAPGTICEQHVPVAGTGKAAHQKAAFGALGQHADLPGNV